MKTFTVWFVQQPELLVADDPIAAVDAVVGGKIFENLKEYTKQHKRGLLIVLNQFHLLQQCDRILFMQHGSVTTGTFDSLHKSSDFQQFMSSYQSKGEEKSVDEVVGEEVAIADTSEQEESKVEEVDKPAQLITKDQSEQGVIQFEVFNLNRVIYVYQIG